MQVKLWYYVWKDCVVHWSMKLPGSDKIASCEECVEALGTPCVGSYLGFNELVEEKDVMERIKLVQDLGHQVEVEYPPFEEYDLLADMEEE